MQFILSAAAIPAIAVMIIIYRLDRVEREPFGLLLKLFFFGVLSAAPAVLIETISGTVVEIGGFSGYGGQIIRCFLCTGLVEEACKLIFLRLGVWKNKNFNYRFDGIVYSVCVSMGFAALENVMYLTQFGFKAFLPRVFLAVPAHLAFAVAMGGAFAEAKGQELFGNKAACRNQLIKALLLSTVFHGFYDYCLCFENVFINCVFLLFAAFLDYYIIRFVRTGALEDAPLPGTGFYEQAETHRKKYS